MIKVIPVHKILIDWFLDHPIYLLAPVFQDDTFIENLGKRPLPDVSEIKPESIVSVLYIFTF
jgi:hypothetical protein